MNAVDDEGATVLGTNQAIQFKMERDVHGDPEPDASAERYRIYAKVSRGDGGSPVQAKNPLRIRP